MIGFHQVGNDYRWPNVSPTTMETSTKKRPLSACEEAIFSCCSSSKSNFVQSARCFEINNCPGINFITNPCLRLSSVINRI